MPFPAALKTRHYAIVRPIARVVLGRVIDALPLSLWKPANLYLGARLHFCSGPAHTDGLPESVRTVEWNGKEIAHGSRPFPHDEWSRRWPLEDEGD